MQAGDIITKARLSLSDTSKLRWTDARLLSLLNDGLSILAIDTILFIEKQYVELHDGIDEYDISSKATKILRAEYKGVPLKMTSHENMDAFDRDWKEHTGLNFTHILTDKHRAGRFKLYPKVANLDASLLVQNSTTGIITDITYTDYELTMTGNAGEIGTPNQEGWAYIHYCKKLTDLTALTDEVDIEDFIAVGLKHYITSIALRDNQDTQNRQLGAEEMQIFEALKDKYSIAKSKMYSVGTLETPYRRAF